MPKIAQVAPQDAAADEPTEKFTKIARRPADAGAGAGATREAMERAQAKAAAALADRGETTLRSSEDATQSGRLLLELFAEQTRHGFEAASVLTRTIDWTEIFAAQQNFVSASLERSRRMNERYREMIQAGMKSAAFPSWR